jgi:hypothetical protein
MGCQACKADVKRLKRSRSYLIKLDVKDRKDYSKEEEKVSQLHYSSIR